MTPLARPGYARVLATATVSTLAVTAFGVLSAPAAPGTPSAMPTHQVSESPATTAATQEADETSPTAEPAVTLPEVAVEKASDFAAGDHVPKGSRVFNTGANRSGMIVTDGALRHGVPEASGAAGFVESRLTQDVRLLGAEVRFAGSSSGSVALVAWNTSLTAARRTAGPTPATGLRLVAEPGQWELSVVADGDVDIIGSGTYPDGEGSARFEVRRDDDRIYVVDPVGAVTVVVDSRGARLAGPWASWGLSETGPDQTPASIEAVWAG